MTEQHILIVTTPGFVKRRVDQHLRSLLSPRRITLWDRVKPNPSLEDLEGAICELGKLDIDCVIGLGGGSSIDSAKILANTISGDMVTSLSQIVRDKTLVNWGPKRLQLIAIPTTAGTGSEVTPFATVWDYAQKKKYSIAGNFMYPNIALLDPYLTLTLNSANTLYPALDAISHALESLWNKNKTPISRNLAFTALNQMNTALPEVLNNPENIKARSEMMVASTCAGLAISQTRTAIAHAISYPLTIDFNIPHGLACSFILTNLIEKNLNRITNNVLEYEILKKTKEMLIALKLGQKISKYASTKELLTSISGKIDITRLSNYDGNIIDDINKLISQSLEQYEKS